MQTNPKLSNSLVGELCSICTLKIPFFAAILGFTGLINQVQYHAAVMDKASGNNAGGWNGRSDPFSSMFDYILLSGREM